MHRGVLELTRVSAFASSSRVRGDHNRLVRNLLPSEEGEISLTTVMATKGGGESAIEVTLGDRKNALY